METSLCRDYILDDTLDKDTPNDDNGINGINDDENYNYDNNGNNDSNCHNDHNDYDNDNNYDNDNGDQMIMIVQAMHFGESFFLCEKAEFCECAQILICLHSVNPCLIYREELRFLKNH